MTRSTLTHDEGDAHHDEGDAHGDEDFIAAIGGCACTCIVMVSGVEPVVSRVEP